MNHEKVRKKDSARLVWDSKPRRAPNPKDIEFQTAEIVIPNPQYKDKLPLSFRDGLFGEKEIDKQKMNRLIWGDNLLAMQALLSQGYEGKINLIYIDPPFDSKADYSHKMTIPINPSPLAGEGNKKIPLPPGEGKGEGIEFTKEPSVIERLAYKDTWAGGTDSYLDMLYPRLQLMKRLLAEDGSVYVHLDYHVGHYVKAIMDEIFSRDNFRNEIVWQRTRAQHTDSKTFGAVHDSILFYSRSNQFTYNIQYKEHKEEYLARFNKIDEHGKRYMLIPAHAAGAGPARVFFGKKINPPKGRHWAYTQENIDKLIAQNKIELTSNGTPSIRHYLEDTKGAAVQSIWTDVIPLNPV